MYYNVILTLKCNLNCLYCGGGYSASRLPKEVQYEIKDLKTFVEQDPNPIILFYGGEPLLRIQLMEDIMNNISADAYILQTNGLLLDKIKPNILKKFHTILISLDGNEEITDFYRGKNTYRTVIKNLMKIRDDFKGEIIARMTISEETEIYDAVNWLLGLRPLIDSIHWQLNMMFDERKKWRDLEDWIKNSYNPQITRLINDWLGTMKMEQRVLKLYPFIAIMESLLKDEHSKLRCGSGWIWFNINTDGIISACPVCSEFEIFQVGNINTSNYKDIKNALDVKQPCLDCEVHSICGGRCLYSNYTKPWGEEGFRIVCSTVKHLIKELHRIQPEVDRLIKDKKIKLEDFSHFRYNGCEIIP
ncbi:MAG: TIGR04084 family radical SAM/SPASM domain-containing protein [Candidatus Helarchaeota archaeon]|nr:TIGR04084 family radical SAM/SPASM domain-containing protein [Candidatus Helarchaeota archaeon]